MALDPMIHVMAEQPIDRTALLKMARQTSYPVTESSDIDALVGVYDFKTPSCVIVYAVVEEYHFFEIHRMLADRDVIAPVIIVAEAVEVPAAVRAVKEGAFDVMALPLSVQPLQSVLDYAIQTDRLRIKSRKACDAMLALLITLTPRERQILRMVLDGKTTSQIAYELVRSEKTIKLHRAHLMKKMKADSAMQLTQRFLTACGNLDCI